MIIMTLSVLVTMLQLALALLVSTHNNASASPAQQEQAITFAAQTIQLVTLSLGNTSSTPSVPVGAPVAMATTATTTVMVAQNGAAPAHFTIPRLGVDAGFQYNGLKPDGTMEVPSNIYDVGWFTGSVYPGEKGVAIITGHVAQIRRGIMTKPGVFMKLSELSPGDKLYVLNNKGESVAFVVRELRTYDPTADATDVFNNPDGGAHLNLITCEGTWDQSLLSFSQRLVVFTDAAQ